MYQNDEPAKMLFYWGKMLITPGAQDALNAVGEQAYTYVIRHLQGDWGEILSEHDKKANTRAVRDGERILSAYGLPDGNKIWVITEADRSATTILLPSEY